MKTKTIKCLEENIGFKPHFLRQGRKLLGGNKSEEQEKIRKKWSKFYGVIYYISSGRGGKMAEQLKALSVLAKNLSSVPSTWN